MINNKYIFIYRNFTRVTELNESVFVIRENQLHCFEFPTCKSIKTQQACSSWKASDLHLSGFGFESWHRYWLFWEFSDFPQFLQKFRDNSLRPFAHTPSKSLLTTTQTYRLGYWQCWPVNHKENMQQYKYDAKWRTDTSRDLLWVHENLYITAELLITHT